MKIMTNFKPNYILTKIEIFLSVRHFSRYIKNLYRNCYCWFAEWAKVKESGSMCVYYLQQNIVFSVLCTNFLPGNFRDFVWGAVFHNACYKLYVSLLWIYISYNLFLYKSDKKKRELAPKEQKNHRSKSVCIGVFLVRILPHSERKSPYLILMRENKDQKNPNMDTFDAVNLVCKVFRKLDSF